MKAKTLYSLFVVVAMLSMAPLGLSATKTLGMVADNDTDSVTIFDADDHAVLGTVAIPFGGVDVLITPDLKLGFVTNGDYKVFVIDLTTSPPSLVGGTNPIPISGAGEDLSISPDGKFLVVAPGTFPAADPMSVIDIAAQTEVSTFFTGDESSDSVEVCNDGSVLVTSFLESGTVRRLTLSGTGVLTDTGEVLPARFPTNVYCTPGAQSGVVTRLEGITSFTIPGLAEVDNRFLSGASGSTGTFNSTGNRVFVRSSRPTEGGVGVIDVFDFNPSAGALGANPLLTFFVGDGFDIGTEIIALHPDGKKLFVSEPRFGSLPSAVGIYDPSTGALLASITDPNIVFPTGVTVVTEADPCALPPPTGAIVGTDDADILNGTPFADTIFGLGGPDQINGKGGNDLICGGDGDDQLNGGAGNDTIKGDSGSDQVTGGAGDDVLDIKDGVRRNDSADGGAHVSGDTCTADPGDSVSRCNP
jgi:Ca2+-binding RTX toxin-like protein